MKSIVAVTAVLATVVVALATPVQADSRVLRPGWRGDIQHFEGSDLQRWRGGAWRHGRHAGRMGWWWVASGTWYLYPGPIYPYPDPYRPPTVVVERPVPPVAAQNLPAIPAPANYWYFCEPAKAYYPYVPSCPSGWVTVPATPTGASQ